MGRLLAAVLACAVATSAAAQPSSHWHGGGHGGGNWNRGGGWHDSGPRVEPWVSFWGGVLGGWIAGQQEQASRPGRDTDDVEGEMEPWSAEWFAYCKRKYRSFDVETGKYLAFDGNHYFCK